MNELAFGVLWWEEVWKLLEGLVWLKVLCECGDGVV